MSKLLREFLPANLWFQVHRDKVLLEQFLTGQWSADDWFEGVSLASFMELESPLKVVNTLALAEVNLQPPCVVLRR